MTPQRAGPGPVGHRDRSIEGAGVDRTGEPVDAVVGDADGVVVAEATGPSTREVLDYEHVLRRLVPTVTARMTSPR